MKENRKVLVAVVALAAVAALLLGIWYVSRPQVQEGSKTLVVEIATQTRSIWALSWWRRA